MSSFRQLEQRFSPITQYGSPISQPALPKRVVYDGTFLPGFIKDNGGEHKSVRGFLRLNRIGSVFDDLEDGEEVFVPGTGISNPLDGSFTRNFPVHPYA